MRLLRWLAVLAPVALAGCISYSSTPARTTVAAPPGATVVCTAGQTC